MHTQHITYMYHSHTQHTMHALCHTHIMHFNQHVKSFAWMNNNGKMTNNWLDLNITAAWRALITITLSLSTAQAANTFKIYTINVTSRLILICSITVWSLDSFTTTNLDAINSLLYLVFIFCPKKTTQGIRFECPPTWHLQTCTVFYLDPSVQGTYRSASFHHTPLGKHTVVHNSSGL